MKTLGNFKPKQHTRVVCDDCALNAICRPLAIGNQAFSAVPGIMERGAPLSAGAYLYHKGNPVESIYAVRSGTLKLLKVSNAGREQVVGFRFPGELVGEEAISPGQHTLNAVAIDNASVCKIPINELDAIAEKIPDFQKNLLELLSRQCHMMHKQFASYAAHNNAEERLSAFILNVAERYSSCAKPTAEIQLAMNRDEMASFLGLRRETLSRTFSKLQRSKVVNVKGKSLQILDLKTLRQLAND